MSLQAIARRLNIAVLQTGRAPDELQAQHGDYDSMCKALLGLKPNEATTYAILDGEFPVEPEAYDVLLITGSRHGVYEAYDWIPRLETLIREAYSRKQKLIGICFGHQIIARALGGVVEKSDKGFGIGVMDYALARQDGAQAPISLCAWHQDQIVAPPPGAKVIAHSEFCAIAGLAYEDIAISFQAHPEFTRDYVRDLIELRTPSMLDPGFATHSLGTLEQSVDQDIIQAEIKQFLKR
ncbi:MAG: type 1 glutamine amidotransferase [Pseudomonadota bacterium]